MRVARGAADARPAHRERDDEERGSDEADRRADDAVANARARIAAAEARRAEPSAADEARGPEDGEGDVERSLARELAAAVERTDERRVNAVTDDDAGDDGERRRDVRGALECGEERRGGCEEEAGDDRRRHVDAERGAQRLFVISARARDGAAHALNRGGDDDVVQDVRDAEDARERAVS